VAKEPRFTTIARIAYCLDLSLDALAADLGLPTIDATQAPAAAMGPALQLAHGLRKRLQAASNSLRSSCGTPSPALGADPVLSGAFWTSENSSLAG
jgi:hypothetical protein